MSKAQRLSTWRNLEKFVVGDDIDPVYFDSPYFVYPDGPIAVEVLRVIGAAMAKVGVVGLGRLTLSRRERMVVVEPRDTGGPTYGGNLCKGKAVLDQASNFIS
jgi:non-homologous end joining protein Ku